MREYWLWQAIHISISRLCKHKIRLLRNLIYRENHSLLDRLLSERFVYQKSIKNIFINQPLTFYKFCKVRWIKQDHAGCI